MKTSHVTADWQRKHRAMLQCRLLTHPCTLDINDGLMTQYDDDSKEVGPNDTAYKQWSCHSGYKLLCKVCRNLPPPAMAARFTVFWANRPCGPARWLALLLIKASDVETNPGPITSHKRVSICDICYKQIHVRKPISIRCNRIEHWCISDALVSVKNNT